MRDIQGLKNCGALPTNSTVLSDIYFTENDKFLKCHNDQYVTVAA